MTGRNSTDMARDHRRAAVRVGILAVMISAALVLPAVGLDTLYPVKDGTIADGQFPEDFDGTPDTSDWYFSSTTGFAGMIAMTFDNLDRRVFWEYDLSGVMLTPPVAATLTFKLKAPCRFPAPWTDVHVYAYAVTLPLSEDIFDDFLADPSDVLQGVASVPPPDCLPSAPIEFSMDVSQVVNSALTSGGPNAAVAFRFQIDPDAVDDNQQARIDALDSGPDTKPILTIDIAPVELPGDIDFDQDVDMIDLEIFVNLLLGPPHSDGYPAEYWDRADLNADGPVDGLDIQLFVDAMTAP